MADMTSTMKSKLNMYHKIPGDIVKAKKLIDDAAALLSDTANTLLTMHEFEFSEEIKQLSEAVSKKAADCEAPKGKAQGKYNAKYDKYMDICTSN